MSFAHRGTLSGHVPVAEDDQSEPQFLAAIKAGTTSVYENKSPAFTRHYADSLPRRRFYML